MKHLLMMPLCAVIMFSTACTRGDDTAMQEVPLATYFVSKWMEKGFSK